MLKECVLLDGQIINIGLWDYKVESVEVEPAKIDEEGNVIEEAVYENQVTNPLPDGAEVVEIEISQNNDGGWYAVDYQPVEQPTETELIGQQLTQVKLQAIQQQQMISSLGAELAAAKLELINLKGADR